jgi:hypothetical protein
VSTGRYAARTAGTAPSARTSLASWARAWSSRGEEPVGGEAAERHDEGRAHESQLGVEPRGAAGALGSRRDAVPATARVRAWIAAGDRGDPEELARAGLV